ncbi:TerC family protein [Desulfotomaculum sp. 1211_IL3151]|uniref:TerC family protein n=1 Tax=Desulfotomaculum sp. 1211_IL3151 TaxID=3084055 RepID=UPI002FD89E0E
MEFLSAEFFSALFAIILIDLVLAGDNAIVIGLAARNLPLDQQKKVIIWGTVGAIAVRAAATLVVVWLLRIPGLLLLGGLLLIWIAYKLLVEERSHNIEAGQNSRAAIQTIIVADAVMGLDNVLAVAGTAHGSFLLVVLGLLISIPIVVWGSTIVIRWIERFPVIIYLGAGVIAITAGKMITDEPLIKNYFSGSPTLQYLLIALITFGVIGAGVIKKKQKEFA